MEPDVDPTAPDALIGVRNGDSERLTANMPLACGGVSSKRPSDEGDAGHKKADETGTGEPATH